MSPTRLTDISNIIPNEGVGESNLFLMGVHGACSENRVAGIFRMGCVEWLSAENLCPDSMQNFVL